MTTHVIMFSITSLAALTKLIMDTQHVASLKAVAGSRVPVAVGVHRGEVVVATPGALSENDVCVWWLCVRERVSLQCLTALKKHFAILVVHYYLISCSNLPSLVTKKL